MMEKKMALVICPNCNEPYNGDIWKYCPFCTRPDMSKIKREEDGKNI